MKQPKAISRPARRRQEDRAAETRGKILDATISCLYQYGYRTTTVALVAKTAQVSTGVIMYHFASKADLMVAVRETVQADEQRLLDETRQRLGTRAYLRQMPHFVLAGMRRPPAIAVNEILLGARSDPELIQKLREMERQIEARSIERMKEAYREIGREPPDHILTSIRVAVAAFRGLAIAELVLGEDQEVDASADMLAAIFREFTGKFGRAGSSGT